MERRFPHAVSSSQPVCVTPETFLPAKRQAVWQQIRDEWFDGILIAYSCFEQIPVSKNYNRDCLIEQKEKIEETIRRSSTTIS